MTHALRTRLIAVVVPLFLLVGGLAAAGVPGVWVGVGAAVAGVVSAAGLVLLTRPLQAVTALADRTLRDANPSAADAHAGKSDTARVHAALDTLWNQREAARDTLATREHEFETALYEVTTALAGLVNDPRKPPALLPPVCPWPDRATAVVTAVKAVGGVLGNTQRRAAGFQTVLNDLPDPVVVVDGDQTVLLANRAAADLFGVEANALNKKPLTSLFLDPATDLWDTEQVPPLGPAQLTGWLANPGTGPAEAIAATPEEGGTRVSVCTRPPIDRGTRQFTVLLLKDLTRQMKKDSDVRLHHRRLVAQRLCLLIENEAKPALETIRTNATLLAQAAKQAGQRERFVPKVQRMMDELSRQEVVITLLGWLGRLTKTFGSSQVMGEVRLKAAVEEVGEKLTAVFGDRNNELTTTGDAGWLMADEEWVTVMLTGLLLHANMSCKASKVAVDLRRRSVVMSDGEQGEILVRYPGPMLSDDALADVREPFRRPNSLALESTSELGFPLGLAVANRITSLMSGQLTIDAEGAGCCVRVLLPTRSTSSRVESLASASGRHLQPTHARGGEEAGDVLSEWTVGGQPSGLELVGSALPAPVDADLPEPAFGENVGDWFPAPTE